MTATVYYLQYTGTFWMPAWNSRSVCVCVCVEIELSPCYPVSVSVVIYFRYIPGICGILQLVLPPSPDHFILSMWLAQW